MWDYSVTEESESVDAVTGGVVGMTDGESHEGFDPIGVEFGVRFILLVVEILGTGGVCMSGGVAGSVVTGLRGRPVLRLSFP